MRAYSFLPMFIVHFINNQLKVQVPQNWLHVGRKRFILLMCTMTPILSQYKIKSTDAQFERDVPCPLTRRIFNTHLLPILSFIVKYTRLVSLLNGKKHFYKYMPELTK